MNEDNFIKLGSGGRTKSEEREIRSLGGKKSGEVRRKKRAMKQALEMILEAPAPADLASDLKAAGLKEDNLTYQMAFLASVIKEAINGNIQAARLVLEILGEDAQSKIKAQELRAKKVYQKRSLEIREAMHTEVFGEYEDLSEAEAEIYGEEMK